MNRSPLEQVPNLVRYHCDIVERRIDVGIQRVLESARNTFQQAPMEGLEFRRAAGKLGDVDGFSLAASETMFTESAVTTTKSPSPSTPK